MRLLAPLLALAALLAAPQAVIAQDEAVEAPRPPVVPPGDDVILSMAVGDRAAVRGMLLDTDTATRWTLRLSWYRNELVTTLSTHRRELQLLTLSHDRELTIVQDSYRREISGLRDDLRQQAAVFTAAQANSHPWYDTFVFGMIVGTVFSGVLVGLTAWASM